MAAPPEAKTVAARQSPDASIALAAFFGTMASVDQLGRPVLEKHRQKDEDNSNDHCIRARARARRLPFKLRSR
jgi:hypothetical protein